MRPARELLQEAGLVQGVPDLSTGALDGASPGVAARLQELTPGARADVLAINELLGLSGVPATLPGRWAATVGVLFGGGAPALLAQAPGVVLGILSGDVSRFALAATGAAVGIAGALGLGVADRALARQAARLTAVDQARGGVTGEVKAVLEASRARLDADLAAVADEITADRADAAAPPAQPTRRRFRVGRPAATQVPRPVTSPSAPPVAPPSGADLLTGADPDAAARVPRRGSWLVRNGAGPALALLGLGVLAVAALPVSTVAAATLGVSVVGAVASAVAQRSLSLAEGRLADARSAVAGARETALGRAVADAELDTAAEQRDRAAALLAQTRDRLAGTTSPTPATPDEPTTHLLVPGPADGVVRRDRLTAPDRARLAQVEQAARIPGADRAGSPEQERLRSAAAAAGMLTDPTSTEEDPDAVGWARRRVLLDPAALAAVQALDTLPPGVAGLGRHLTTGLLGSAVPGAAAATVAALVGVGVGPLSLVTIGLAPAAAAAAAAYRTHRVGTARQQADQQRSARRTALRAPARDLLDAEVQRIDDETAALDAERAALVPVADAAQDAAQRLAERTARRRRPALDRLVDALVGPGDPAVQVPTAPAAVAPPAVAEPAAPPPVRVRPALQIPVLGPFVGAVSGSVVAAAGALTAWQLAFAGEFGPLWSPGTWAELTFADPASGLVAGSALATGAAVAAVVGAGAAEVGARVTGRSQAAAAERREAVLRAHEAHRARAVREALLGERHDRLRELGREAAVRRRARDAGHLADLGRRDAEVPARGPGVVPRLAGWLAGLGDDAVAAIARQAPDGSPLLRAALARLADRLPQLTPERAEQLLPAAVDGVRRSGLRPGAPSGSPALDRLVATVDRVDAERPDGEIPVPAAEPAAPAPTPVASRTDWAQLRRIIQVSGWWPERPTDPAPDLLPLDRVADPEPDRGMPSTPDRGMSAPPDRGTAPTTPTTPPPSAPTPVPPAPPAVPGRPVPPLPYDGPGQRPAPRPAPQPDDGPVDGPHPEQPGVVRTLRPGADGVVLSTLVPVTSPGGQVCWLLAQWVDAGPGQRPVLVLTELPGTAFWWGVPAAVLQAVDQALDLLAPAPELRSQAVVLGRRAVDGGRDELTEYRLDLSDGRPAPGAGPRTLPPEEVTAALGALRLPELPGLLAQLGVQPAVSR